MASLEITEGTWVKCKLSGHWSFTTRVLKVHDDGSVDLLDRNGNLRTLIPGNCEKFETTKAPKVR